MKKIENFESVEVNSGEFKKVVPNGYVCKITYVEDCPFDEKTQKGDYLKIEYDIAEGDLSGYYKETFDRTGSWWGSFFRSYKQTALGMFKHFINCVSESNPKFTWNWDESAFHQQFVGLVIGEEEYKKNDGTIGTRLYVKEIKTIEEIRNGDFKIPSLKKLKVDNVPTFTDISNEIDDDLPF